MPVPPRLEISERRAAARRRARRRGQIRLAVLVVLLVVIVVLIVNVAGSGTNPSSRTAAAKTHVTAKTAKGHGTAVKVETNPLTTPGMKRWVAQRQGDLSAAVVDVKTGKEWILDPSARDQTASIVKADILETVLYQAQEKGEPVADAESDTAQGMIEASDNDDASDLWSQVGAASGIADYNAKAGLTETTPGQDGYWGETLTSAADQIRLLRQLAIPKSSVLSAASIAYQLSLMEQIDPGENWGVTGGVPSSGVTVALKNGWVPLTSNTDWEVNSIGWVKGDDHDYLIAVLTAHDPSEDYGIDTIDKVSQLVYDTIGPKPAAGTATIEVTPSG